MRLLHCIVPGSDNCQISVSASQRCQLIAGVVCKGVLVSSYELIENLMLLVASGGLRSTMALSATARSSQAPYGGSGHTSGFSMLKPYSSHERFEPSCRA